MDGPIAPASFPRELAVEEATRQFLNFSEGEESSMGRWANGPLYDGTGNFEYVAKPRALGQEPELAPAGPEPRQVRGCFFA